jgi:hypothetical protein
MCQGSTVRINRQPFQSTATPDPRQRINRQARFGCFAANTGPGRVIHPPAAINRQHQPSGLTVDADG